MSCLKLELAVVNNNKPFMVLGRGVDKLVAFNLYWWLGPGIAMHCHCLRFGFLRLSYSVLTCSEWTTGSFFTAIRKVMMGGWWYVGKL